jgi:hypothetical protein
MAHWIFPTSQTHVIFTTKDQDTHKPLWIPILAVDSLSSSWMPLKYCLTDPRPLLHLSPLGLEKELIYNQFRGVPISNPLDFHCFVCQQLLLSIYPHILGDRVSDPSYAMCRFSLAVSEGNCYSFSRTFYFDFAFILAWWSYHATSFHMFLLSLLSVSTIVFVHNRG